MYKAFISYKHSEKDGSYARAIESSLKKYAKPLFKLPIRIFRDESELIPGKGLNSSIRQALETSNFLILIASTDSAKSQWVQEELTIWCTLPEKLDRLIIVCIDGSIAYNPLTCKIDWKKTDAIPSQIKNYVSEVPLYIDLRWVQDESELDLSNIRYRELINAISARLHNRTPYEMNGIEVKTTKKNIRLRNYALFAISFLFVLAVILSIYSNIQRKIAVERAEIAESRSLAMQSSIVKHKSFNGSLLFATQAYSTKNTLEAKGALLEALNYNPSLEFSNKLIG